MYMFASHPSEPMSGNFPCMHFVGTFILAVGCFQEIQVEDNVLCEVLLKSSDDDNVTVNLDSQLLLCQAAS